MMLTRLSLLCGLLLAVLTFHTQAQPCPDKSTYQALQQQLESWDDSYHRLGISQVSDAVYDASRTRFEQWQSCFEELRVANPLLPAGWPVTPPVVHTAQGGKRLAKRPTGSVDSTQS